MRGSGKPSATDPLHDVVTRRLVLGLPAVAAMLGIVVLTAVILTASSAEVVERYTSEARRSMRAGEYDRARECYARLLDLKSDDQGIRYETALLELQLGHDDRATAILARLAPLDAPGYGPAHVWWARRYLASIEQGGDPRGLRAAEAHLQRAIEANPEDAVAHVLVGRVYLAAREYERAAQHLLYAARSLPEARLDLAKAYRASGRQQLAEEQARTAIEIFRGRVASVSADSNARVAWSKAARFLNDFDTAVRVLTEGLMVAPDPAYREELGRAYAEWSTAIALEPDAATEQVLATVEQGLHHDSDNLELLAHLLQLCRAEGDAGQRAQMLVKLAIGHPASRPVLHMLIGMEAQKRGEETAAIEHYEAAYAEAPHLSLAANNLAWMLAHAQRPDLQRALEMIDELVQRWPDQVDFRDTRGHILAKMGRYHEALNDLKRVAAARPGNAQVHKTLANIFDQAGIPDAAAEHRRLAAQARG